MLRSTIVVIGSNSFSGSHFVKHALSEGYSVVGISRSAEPLDVFLPYRRLADEIQAQFTFYRYDLNHDGKAVADLCGQLGDIFIVNFAAQGMVAEAGSTRKIGMRQML